PGLEGRPDFEAARLASSAEAARATRAHRALFPSLNLSYSQGQIETGGQWESEWRTSLVLSIPLFSGWEDVAAYRAQSETARQAELTLEQLRRDGLSYQRAHQENFKIGLQTAENRERVLVTSQRLLKKNLLRSQAGRASANDLLVERGREAQAELVAVEGWARAHAALVQLYHAFGQSVRGL
ncbi:MAG TPA: TolC family protein, partial [Bdellovibrionales bacterium]|nr:TolC family protein [Bdellovibrionales bacterium]